MVSSSEKTVDEYLQTLPPDRAEGLAQLRAMILEVAPDVEESMKYRMPTYEYGPGILAALAAQKQYLSLSVEVQILDRYRDEFGHLNCGKSCIRFRSIDKLPLDTVKTILTETRDRLDGVTAEEV